MAAPQRRSSTGFNTPTPRRPDGLGWEFLIAGTAPLELIILAAGIGSRFGGDKQIEGFGPHGETLPELNAFDGVQAGVERVTWVTREDLVPAISELTTGFPSELDVRVCVQDGSLDPSDSASPTRNRPWGTAHAWKATAPKRGPTLVVNADDIYGAEAMRAVAAAVRDAAQHGSHDRPVAWVAGYPVAKTLSAHGGVSRALIEVAAGDAQGGCPRVTALTELHSVRRAAGGVIAGLTSAGREVQLDERSRVSMNLWGFRGAWGEVLAARLERFKQAEAANPDAEFRIPDVVFDSVAEGVADAFLIPVQSRWVGVTFPEDRAHLKAALLEDFDSGVYPSPLFTPSSDSTNACS